jgi:hypothetical protein
VLKYFYGWKIRLMTFAHFLIINAQIFYCEQTYFIYKWCDISSLVGGYVDGASGSLPDHAMTSRLPDGVEVGWASIPSTGEVDGREQVMS